MPPPSDALYDETPPRRVHEHPTADGHRLVTREWGSAHGLPALVLHGGPGSGASPLLARVFDPARWRVVVPDQRGAGLSTPRGATHANTLEHLIADLRALRRELGVARWLVVGGSWGATLALAYAAEDPGAVGGLLLRSAFVARDADVDAFFAATAGRHPAAWRALCDAAGAPVATSTPALLGALDAALADPARREPAALAWRRWERAQSSAAGDAAAPVADDAAALVDRYRVQVRYLRDGCGLRERPLLGRVRALPPVPTRLLHADDDRVCPPAGARELAAALPHAVLRIVPGAGHDPAHPAMAAAMVAALRDFADRGDFGRADDAGGDGAAGPGPAGRGIVSRAATDAGAPHATARGGPPSAEPAGPVPR